MEDGDSFQDHIEEKNKSLLLGLSGLAFGWFRGIIYSHIFWSLDSLQSKKLLRIPKSFCLYGFYLLIFTKLEIKIENLKICIDLLKK